jgi:hypothetical protein
MTRLAIEVGIIRPGGPDRFVAIGLGLIGEQLHRRAKGHQAAHHDEFGLFEIPRIDRCEPLADLARLFAKVLPVPGLGVAERGGLEARQGRMAGGIHRVRHGLSFGEIPDMARCTDFRAANGVPEVGHAVP